VADVVAGATTLPATTALIKLYEALEKAREFEIY
jgi:hypothetical protein